MSEDPNDHSSSQIISHSSSSESINTSPDDVVGRSPPADVDFSNRGRVNRSIGFLERVLMTAEIDEKGGNVDARVMDIERAIERLWSSLADDASAAQDERNGGPSRTVDIKDDDGPVRFLYA
jgi:hypothetical protein